MSALTFQSDPADRDWTEGVPAIHYQICERCNAVWYFRRSFCPACGDGAPVTRKASGLGVIYSLTIVRRAPTAELIPYSPYCVVLVDASEGFRLMAHGDESLAIGDPVKVEYREFGGRLIPHFCRA